jgi:hypothetical protein
VRLRRLVRPGALACAAAVAVAACSVDNGAAGTPGPQPTSPVTATTSVPTTTTTTGPATTTVATTTTEPATTTVTTAAPATTGPLRPTWLGTRPLPVTATGFGAVTPTPPELVDRRLPPPPEHAAPAAPGFAATVEAPSDDVLARSTWAPGCPVDRSELRLIRMTYRGFDGLPHLGEMLVHADVAADLVQVFSALYDAGFPIEEMRVVSRADLDAPPTGDGNNTTAFACRPVTGTTGTWSQHAYGLAVDVNPFHNPYLRGEVVLPELAGAYLDRDRDLPGMVRAGDAVVSAFAAIGWEWGGDWSSLKDWQHFSRDGR